MFSKIRLCFSHLGIKEIKKDQVKHKWFKKCEK